MSSFADKHGHPWQYSTVHNSVCKIIEEQTLLGQTVCRIWLPNQNAVVRVPRFPLRPLTANLQAEIDAGCIAYVGGRCRTRLTPCLGPSPATECATCWRMR
jgi:hypothetical protein